MRPEARRLVSEASGFSPKGRANINLMDFLEDLGELGTERPYTVGTPAKSRHLLQVKFYVIIQQVSGNVRYKCLPSSSHLDNGFFVNAPLPTLTIALAFDKCPFFKNHRIHLEAKTEPYPLSLAQSPWDPHDQLVGGLSRTGPASPQKHFPGKAIAECTRRHEASSSHRLGQQV